MGLKFARTFTQQALLDAWQEVRDSALADSRLDPELERFEADAARQVSHLALALTQGECAHNPHTSSRSPSPAAELAGSPSLPWPIGWSNGPCW